MCEASRRTLLLAIDEQAAVTWAGDVDMGNGLSPEVNRGSGWLAQKKGDSQKSFSEFRENGLGRLGPKMATEIGSPPFGA